MAEPRQVWVRNEKGKVWGPLLPSTLELLFDNGIVEGKVQLSNDGLNFVFPGRMPGVRQAVPRELWGEVVVPDTEADQLALSPATIPPSNTPAPVQGNPGAVPMAGPGIAAAAGRSAAPMAGPGTRQGAPQRPPGPSRQTGAPPVLGAPQGTATPVPGPPVMAAQSPAAGPGVPGPPVMTPSPAAQPQPQPQPQAPRPPSGLQSVPGTAAVAKPAAAMPPDSLPATGELSKVSPLQLYYLAATGEVTGLLTLTLPDRVLSWHFRKGNPEFIDSTHADDSLSNFLVKQRLVTFDQLGKAEANKANFGGELVPALFGMGILNPGTAFQQLAVRAQNLLAVGLLAESGTFTFEPKELPPSKALPLGNRWALICEPARKLIASEVKRRLGEAMDLPIMKSSGRVPLSDLRLTPQETRAYSHFDGVRSLAQLCAALPAETDHLLRVAWLLHPLEAVSYAAVKVKGPATPPPAGPPQAAQPQAAPPHAAQPQSPPVAAQKPAAAPSPTEVAAPKPAAAPAAKPPPAQAPQGSAAPAAAPARPAPNVPGPPPAAARAVPGNPPAAAKPAAPVAAPEDFPAEITRLTQLLETMKKQNLFEVLGLTPQADGAAARTAYLKLARQYHPDTVPPGAPEALAKARADIFARIGEAQRVLTDEKSRNEYAADLAAGGGNADKVDIAQILAAEEMFQKGQILVKAKKFPEAVKMLEEAIKANADEGEYYAWRGYAKFFTHSDRKAGQAEAMKDIGLCLKKNEKVAAAWYFQGHMAKLLGNTDVAKKSFQRCVELNPEHIDAQRELRMMK